MTIWPDIFFDLDGTLVDPRLGITGCLRYALEKLGGTCPGDAELTKFIGPPLRAVALETASVFAQAPPKAPMIARPGTAKRKLYEGKTLPPIAQPMPKPAAPHKPYVEMRVFFAGRALTLMAAVPQRQSRTFTVGSVCPIVNSCAAHPVRTYLLNKNGRRNKMEPASRPDS